MKKLNKVFVILLCLAVVCGLVACGTTDFKTETQGTWTLYHWYEHVENGEDVFLDDTNFYTVTISEDSFTVTAEDDSLDNVGGVFTWTKSDEAEVVMNDGTRCTIQVTENSKEHNEEAMWDVFVVETNMTYVLENPKGTE
jgi:hypothetical protein